MHYDGVKSQEDSPTSQEESQSLTDESQFQTPLKTSSPNVTMTTWEEMRVLLDAAFKTQNEELKKEMQDSESRIKEELNKRMGQIEKKNAEMEEKFTENTKQWQQERKALMERLDEQDRRLERAERSEKRCNVIVSNLETKTEGSGLSKELEDLFTSKTGKELKVAEARKWINRSNKTVIWARLQTVEQKIDLMRNKKLLNQKIDGQNRPIYVDDDQTREEREISYRARQCRGECAKNFGAAEIKYERGRPIVKSKGKTWKWNGAKKDFELVE